MPAPGEVRYARASGDVDIAYTVFGTGAFDLVLVQGFVTHLDLEWDFPWFDTFRYLAGVCRVITFDKHGTGLSDRSLGFGSLEERTDDIRAVMDAAGSQRAVVYGTSEGGPMAIYFAAQYPERVRALVLCATAAKFAASPDNPEGIPSATAERLVTDLVDGWGTGRAYGLIAQHAPDDDRVLARIAQFERSACTPQMTLQIMDRNLEIDVRSLLPTLSVPTLVVHCTGDPLVPVGLGRRLGESIPGARYVEIPGDFHASWRVEDIAALGSPFTQFLVELGVDRPRVRPDRVLTTVMFVDIVGSTDVARSAGDRTWSEILRRYHGIVCALVEDGGGRVVDTAGDGVLATFTRPSAAIHAAVGAEAEVQRLGLKVRAGIHTGEVELTGDRVTGVAVHLAARIAAAAEPDQVMVSRTVKDLVSGSDLELVDRGQYQLKGLQGSWQLFSTS